MLVILYDTATKQIIHATYYDNIVDAMEESDRLDYALRKKGTTLVQFVNLLPTT